RRQDPSPRRHVVGAARRLRAHSGAGCDRVSSLLDRRVNGLVGDRGRGVDGQSPVGDVDADVADPVDLLDVLGDFVRAASAGHAGDGVGALGGHGWPPSYGAGTVVSRRSGTPALGGQARLGVGVSALAAGVAVSPDSCAGSLAGLKPRNRRLLVTTKTEEKAIA